MTGQNSQKKLDTSTPPFGQQLGPNHIKGTETALWRLSQGDHLRGDALEQFRCGRTHLSFPTQGRVVWRGSRNLEEALGHQVLSTAETAAFLSLSVVTLRRMNRRGLVPPPVRVGERRIGWRL